MPVLALQVGHGGRTTGATGTPGEQRWARTVAHHVRDILSARRSGGWAVRILEADEPLRAYRGEAFVAIHADGSIHPGARGASFGYQTPAGLALGLDWAQRYEAAGWTGGFRPPNYTRGLARYYGVRLARAAENESAAILEGGFLTNKSDRSYMTSPQGVEAMASAIAGAVAGDEEPDDIEGRRTDIYILKDVTSTPETYHLMTSDGLTPRTHPLNDEERHSLNFLPVITRNTREVDVIRHAIMRANTDESIGAD